LRKIRNVGFINLFFIFLLFLNPSLSASRIISAEGEACHSDIRKAKEKALKRAELDAVERHIGVLISSKSLIVNGRLFRDIIQARVLGTVRLVGEPIYGDTKVMEREGVVCIKVKAKFEISEESIKPANFGLVLLLNKKEFKPGEELNIEISSEKSCYPYLFSVDATGRVYRLLPNPIEDTRLLNGKLIFPTDAMKSRGYRLVVIPVKGREFPQIEEIVFLCTKDKVKGFERYFPSAFAQDEEELYKILKMNYPVTVEKFNEILLQIGAENYDMVDGVYKIKYLN